MSAEKRKGLIDEALGYVTKDRNSSYGEPEDNFQAIADVWNAQGIRLQNGSLIKPVDVALMMAGMKLARLKHNPSHRDSWVDLIGYAACGGDVAVTSREDVTLIQVSRDELGPDVLDPVAVATKNITDYVKGVVTETTKANEYSYWVSDKRCTDRKEDEKWVVQPHGPHLYGGGTETAKWCDGYVVRPWNLRVDSDLDYREKVRADVEKIKEVADRYLKGNKRVSPQQVTEATGHEDTGRSD